jgi:hypothetical protein
VFTGTSPADLFDVAAGAVTATLTPYAPASAMGLDSFGPGTDSIDALVLFDNPLVGGPGNGGPGAEPVTDYALFSLAPGSASLARFGLDAADVFFSDFSGAFAVYASSAVLGLAGRDSIDALDFEIALCGAAAKPKFSVKKLLTPPGDDKLILKGEMVLLSPHGPALDPLLNGVRLRVDDTGGNVLDVSLPPGAFDKATGAGWKTNKQGTKWTYKDKSEAPPGGIVKVKIQDDSSTEPGRMKVLVTGRNGSYPVSPDHLPVRALLATTGQCGEAVFPGPPPTPSCTFNESRSTLRCK